MLLRDHRTTNSESPKPGSIDQFPGTMTGWILECAATCTRFHRLGLSPVFGNAFHLCEYVGALSRLPLEQGLREYEIIRDTAMAVGIVHIGNIERVNYALAINGARFNENVLGFSPVRPTVHPECAANPARNPTIKRKPGYPGICRRTRNLNIWSCRSCANTMAVFYRNIAESAPQPDDNALDAAIAHQQV